MNTKSPKANARKWSCPKLLPGALVLALALLAGGCSQPDRRGNYASASGGELFLPQPPVFLTGPAGVMLTNSPGFSAWVRASGPAGPLRSGSGQLVAQGGKFFFEPAEGVGKHARAGRFSFIWDATTNRGYILSETLQGYAPIVSAVRYTNLVFKGAPTTVEKIEGHPIEQATLVVDGSDGRQSRFGVSRARDLAGLPIRIASTGEPAPYTITLSQIRMEMPPAKLFLPPDGFIEYPSEEAMMSELAARQRGGHQGGQDGAEEAGHSDSGRGRRSKGGSDTGP
ncbi:MAG: hypothetical protein JWR26_3794 [Pedosphaera sp.]|nr:hypothetical protein [Pedosphaera sp.]